MTEKKRSKEQRLNIFSGYVHVEKKKKMLESCFCQWGPEIPKSLSEELSSLINDFCHYIILPLKGH